MNAVGKVTNGKFEEFANTRKGGSQDLSELTGRVATAEEDIDALETNVAQIDDVITAQGTAINNLDTRTTQQGESITSAEEILAQHGVTLDDLAEKVADILLHKISADKVLTAESESAYADDTFLMSGKKTASLIDQLNGKLGSTNESVLSTSVLNKAVEIAAQGLFMYILSGAGYKGEDLPNFSYAYGNAIILKRLQTNIKVILTGIGSAPLATKFYDGTNWGDWQFYVRTSDLGYVDIFFNTVADHSVEILNAPNAFNYIPVVFDHNKTNECLEHIFWESDKWRIYSTVEQSVGVRFYKYPV